MSQQLLQKEQQVNSELAQLFNSATDDQILRSAVAMQPVVFKTYTKPNLLQWALRGNEMSEIAKTMPSQAAMRKMEATKSFEERCKALGVQVSCVQPDHVQKYTINAYVSKLQR